MDNPTWKRYFQLATLKIQLAQMEMQDAWNPQQPPPKEEEKVGKNADTPDDVPVQTRG